MLDERRVKEAELNVKHYLAEGLLKRQPFQKEVHDILSKNAQESLELSGFLLSNGRSDLWIIVTAYYAMYYKANAVLLTRGYKVGDRIAHKVTADALIVFARNDLKAALLEAYEETQDQALAAMKADDLLEDFDRERRKRNAVQYEIKEPEKHAKATTSLERAKRFLFELEKLDGKKKG